MISQSLRGCLKTKLTELAVSENLTTTHILNTPNLTHVHT